MSRPDWAAVLFDLDGTLADTVELILHCYRHTMRTHRGREMPDEPWLATIGRPLRASFADFARDADEVERMVETYVSHQKTIHDAMVCGFPGASDVLDALHARGVPVAIVTSKGREVAGQTLGCCDLDGYFDVVITPEDVTHGKPHPEPVLLALERLGVDEAERVLFVGDAPWDIRAGKAAGVRTAGVLWGPNSREILSAEEPDFLVASLEEVPDLRP